MTGDPPEFRDLEVASFTVVFDEVGFVQLHGRRMNQVFSPLLQQRICPQLVVGNPVQSRSSQHPDVKVGVAQPLNGLFGVSVRENEIDKRKEILVLDDQMSANVLGPSFQ